MVSKFCFFLWEMVIGESFFFKSACTGAGLTAAVDGNFSFAVKNLDFCGCCAHFAWGKKHFMFFFFFIFHAFKVYVFFLDPSVFRPSGVLFNTIYFFVLNHLSSWGIIFPFGPTHLRSLTSSGLWTTALQVKNTLRPMGMWCGPWGVT